MQQQKWLALGQALKALRTDRDIGQKTIIERSGEALVERTLRIYESGQQRPSRDRLLKFLTRSFEMTNVPEVNRYLEMSGYALLSGGEIQQLGLGERPDMRRGKPADFRLEVSTLIVTDGQGRELWRHEFSSRFEIGAYNRPDAIKRCTFADFDSDGGVETLFVYVPLEFSSVGTTLFCFAQDGSLKWQFEPGGKIADTRQEYFPPFFISNVLIVPVLGSGTRILVSSNHYLHNPNQIAMLSPSGKLVSEYWHSGHLLTVTRADLDGDGIEEILLGGVNNGYRQATMIVFDPREISGASAQPDRQILGFPPGTEKAVVLFPKTCLARTSPYNRVQTLWVTKERRIVVPVVEGVSEAKNPGVMIYELDFGLNVVSARPDSHLQESHRILEEEGQLDHAWTEEETARLRSQVIVKRGL
jgi:transcriptional regulator with XRE-family HTH domain